MPKGPPDASKAAAHYTPAQVVVGQEWVHDVQAAYDKCPAAHVRPAAGHLCPEPC